MSHPDRWIHVAGLYTVILAATASADSGAGESLWLPWALPAGVLWHCWGSGFLPLGSWSPRMRVWRWVGQNPSGAVISVPVMQSHLASAWQPFHGQPLLGGMVEDERSLAPTAWLDFWTAQSC